MDMAPIDLGCRLEVLVWGTIKSKKNKQNKQKQKI